MYTIITAKYRGFCAVCGGGFEAGARIKYTNSKRTIHEACEIPELPPNAGHLSIGSGYAEPGFAGFQPKTVLRNPDPEAVKRGQPEFLYVLLAWAQYYPEDGLSFGVGDDSGYIYEAMVREATEEESAPLQAALAEKAQREQAEARRLALASLLREIGQFPNPADPLGDRIMDRQNLYGGGDWFILGDNEIWYVLNNGHDGDDWSMNNVRTGGAGAMGWKATRTEELTSELLTIETILDPATQANRAQLKAGTLANTCYQKHFTGRIDDSVWGEPTGNPAQLPRCPLVKIADAEIEDYLDYQDKPAKRTRRYPVLAGIDSTGDCWLAIRYENAYNEYNVHSFTAGNYGFALRYDQTPERLATITAHLPDWLSPELLETYKLAKAAAAAADAKAESEYRAWVEANPAPVWRKEFTKEESAEWMEHNKSHEKAKMDEFRKIGTAREAAESTVWEARGELRGRFRMREIAQWLHINWTDNARSALWEAAIEGLPVDTITYTNAHIVNAYPGANGAGPWQLWSDGAITIGKCAALEPPKTLSDEASYLISLACREKDWDKKEVLSLQTAVEIDRFIMSHCEGRNEKRKLEKLTVTYSDGQEPRALYLVTIDWWHMGEDGDAGTDMDLYKIEGEARAKFQQVA
jgi:hypothetical protein